MLIASETIWCDFLPLMLAMKPTPQESFSMPRSYMPSAGGRQSCSRVLSAGFEAAVADRASATMFSRSNSDPLILFLSIRLRASPHRRRTLAFAAPTGPPLVLREPQFLKFRPGRSTSLRNGLACTALELVAPRFRCNPCAGTAP